jgi:hypothetical protein
MQTKSIKLRQQINVKKTKQTKDENQQKINVKFLYRSNNCRITSMFSKKIT